MASNPALTRRQQSIFDYLLERHYSDAPPPTLDELCAALQLSSRGSMHKQIQGLVEAGVVEPMHGQQRGVRLTESAAEAPGQIPLLGFIAAGRPIEAVQHKEFVEVPPQLRSEKNCYVLRVKGDSMVEDGIFDGDWVVVEHREHARNGEIVVALVDGSEATLKRIHQRRGQVELRPANSKMQSMVYRPDQVQIQGVVVGQMRSYR